MSWSIAVLIKPSEAHNATCMAQSLAKLLLTVKGVLQALSSTIIIASNSSMLSSNAVSKSVSVGVSPSSSQGIFCVDVDTDFESNSCFFRHSSSEITCDMSYLF